MKQVLVNALNFLQDTLSSKPENHYGWVPQFPDIRDHKYRMYRSPAEALTLVPERIDLSHLFPNAWDQGSLGSSVSHAVADAIYICKGFHPSRLDLYFQARDRSEQSSFDVGCSIRETLKAISDVGVLSESHYPYKEQNFRKRPPVYGRVQFDDFSYMSLDNQKLVELKTCLAAGFPFIFGMSAYRAFDSAKLEREGILTKPRSNDEVLGGLCVLCIGYDDTTNQFLIRNSWGPSWGLNGYFKVPYSYLTTQGLVSDFWTIRA